MIAQIWDKFVSSSWARKHAISIGWFLAGALLMSMFWQEIKVVAEMRGYSMDDVRTGLKMALGAVASIALGVGYGGTFEKHRRDKLIS